MKKNTRNSKFRVHCVLSARNLSTATTTLPHLLIAHAVPSAIVICTPLLHHFRPGKGIPPDQDWMKTSEILSRRTPLLWLPEHAAVGSSEGVFPRVQRSSAANGHQKRLLQTQHTFQRLFIRQFRGTWHQTKQSNIPCGNIPASCAILIGFKHGK